MLYTFARKRLLNGRYGKRNAIEHVCSGCCRDAEHAMEQIEQHVIDRIPPPGVIKSSSWTKNVSTLDFHGFFLCCHDCLPIVSERTLFEQKNQANKADQQLPMLMDGRKPADDVESGEEGEEVFKPDGFDLELPDPCKDKTEFIRQKTFRANARLWWQSKPIGRVMGLVQVMSVQQQNQRLWARHVGPKV